ncbi:hypothetical protein BurJ1DRAFT_3267 [Burkholderiales bacterium JOSHI_001]|nr:hypothetical protein BurJ1DRAFT_3267 [Burkholderiales bacterium JOSHI_001]
MAFKVTSTVNVRPQAFGPLADEPELQVLAEYVRAKRCALFVGAGLSAACGLPNWPELMARLIDRAAPWRVDRKKLPRAFTLVDDDREVWRGGVVKAACKRLGQDRMDTLISQVRAYTGQSLPWAMASLLQNLGRAQDEHDELSRLLAQKRYPEVASACREILGQAGFEQALQRALEPTKPLSAAHQHIARTPYACVVTTNFDDLIECAYAQAHGGTLPRAPTGTDLHAQGTLLMDGAFFVLKAHGDLRRPETLIFSADDYRRVIHAAPAFQAVFNTILMTHALLFVGYSLSDTNFRLMLDEQLTVFNGQVPPRYAILSGIGQVETDLLWRTSRLRVLTYDEDQHQNVEHALAVLAASAEEPTTNATPAPAQARQPLPRASREVRTAENEATRVLSIALRDDRLQATLWEPASGASLACEQAVASQALLAVADATRKAVKVHDHKRLGTDEIRACGQALAACLPPPVLEWLRQLPAGEPLGLRCLDGTHALPWEWLTLDDETLSLRLPLRRLSHSLVNAARGHRLVGAQARVLLIGDAGDGGHADLPALPDSDREVNSIAALLRRHLPPSAVTVFRGPEATRDRVLDAVRHGGYDIVHFAGHAWVNARESYFMAWDHLILGSQLTPALSAQPPALMVLSTHFSLCQPWGTDLTFAELTGVRQPHLRDLAAMGTDGFGETAMRCGVGAFIGSLGETPSADTADAMIVLYQQMLLGKTIDRALHQVQCASVRQGHSTALLFGAMGYRDIRLGRLAGPRSSGPKRR